MLVQEFATFAARFNVAVEDAYVLPALFENAAEKANVPLRGLLAEATYRNNPLGEYMAKVAKTVAETMRLTDGADTE